jgi:hypothetical protein
MLASSDEDGLIGVGVARLEEIEGVSAECHADDVEVPLVFLDQLLEFGEGVGRGQGEVDNVFGFDGHFELQGVVVMLGILL